MNVNDTSICFDTVQLVTDRLTGGQNSSKWHFV